jgi:hypothetical protein
MKKELIKLDAKMQEDASEDSFEVQCQVLGMLLNHKVTEFHFPQELMIMDNKAAATALCRRLVDQRPHRLHTLVSLSPSTDDYWDFTPLVNSMVAVFPNIKVLRMDGCMFGDNELCRIADQLPKLR